MQRTTENITSAVSAGSGITTATIAGLQLSDVGIIVGIVFTISSFIASIYFHCRQAKREDLLIRRLRGHSIIGQVLETPIDSETDDNHQER